MSEPTISESFRDGMVWVSVNGGTEFDVHPSQWNDPGQRRFIIENEIEKDNPAAGTP